MRKSMRLLRKINATILKAGELVRPRRVPMRRDLNKSRYVLPLAQIALDPIGELDPYRTGYLPCWLS